MTAIAHLVGSARPRPGIQEAARNLLNKYKERRKDAMICMFEIKEDFEPIPSLEDLQYLKAVKDAATFEALVSVVAKKHGIDVHTFSSVLKG